MTKIKKAFEYLINIAHEAGFTVDCIEGLSYVNFSIRSIVFERKDIYGLVALAHEVGHALTYDEYVYWKNNFIFGKDFAVKKEEIKAWSKAELLLSEAGIFKKFRKQFNIIKKESLATYNIH